MPRNKRKKSKPAGNSSSPIQESPPQPLLKLESDLKKLQIAAYVRALTPIPKERRPKFKFATRDDIITYQATLMEIHMDRLLSERDMIAQNQAIRNLTALICPAPVTMIDARHQELHYSIQDREAIKKASGEDAIQIAQAIAVIDKIEAASSRT